MRLMTQTEVRAPMHVDGNVMFQITAVMIRYWIAGSVSSRDWSDVKHRAHLTRRHLPTEATVCCCLVAVGGVGQSSISLQCLFSPQHTVRGVMSGGMPLTMSRGAIRYVVQKTPPVTSHRAGSAMNRRRCRLHCSRDGRSHEKEAVGFCSSLS